MTELNYMIPYWDQIIEDGERRVLYAVRQREPLLLRAIGQMAIPIEAAMEEENLELYE
jgi:hypothetical protein